MRFGLGFIPGDEAALSSTSAQCMPTRRGHPWRKLMDQYRIKNLRMLFEHGRNIGHENSRSAEVRFVAWCRRHGVRYRPANYGLRPVW